MATYTAPDTRVAVQPKPDAVFFRVDTYRRDAGTLVGFYLTKADAEQAIREFPNEVDFAEGDFGQISIFLCQPDSVDGIDTIDHDAMLRAWKDAEFVDQAYYVA